MDKDTTIKNDGYFLLASLGLLAGNAVFGFMPGGNLVPMVLSSAMSGILIDDVFTSKWEKLFKNCGLCNADKQFPTLFKKIETAMEISYIFDLPKGICLTDFINKKEQLEVEFKNDIRISLTANYKVIIKVFKTYVIESKWERLFKNCGLRNADKKYPELKTVEENELGKRFTFKLPEGFCIGDFEKCRDEMATAMHEPLKIDITDDFDLVVQMANSTYKDVYKLDKDLVNKNNLIFATGVELTSDGAKVAYIEFNRTNSHMLVCGGTGKGKTVFMRNIVAQCMLKNNTEIYLCDLKATGSYNLFKKCRNLKTMVKSIPDTENLIRTIKKTMDERYKILNENDLSDQQEYNKKFPNRKMKNIIFIIEEIVNLTNSDKIIDLLNILLAQASGAGIYIFMTVQRPCSKTLDTRLKANLSYTVAFQAKNGSNSEIYLDKGDFRAATDLKGAGEALLVTDNKDIYFKSFYLESEEVIEMVKHTYIEKPNDDEEPKDPGKPIDKKDLKLIKNDKPIKCETDLKEVDIF